jgi:hypothetical protein
MPLNFPGEYTARFFYTTIPTGLAPLQHTSELNFTLFEDANPGDDPAILHPIIRAGTHVKTLDDHIIEWGTLLADAYSSGGAASIDYAEVWKYAPGTFDATFITSVPLAFSGTRVAAPFNSSQMIMTFRTTLGGIAKLSLMETPQPGTLTDAPPFAEASLQAIADAFVGGVYPWVGRDGGFPFVTLRLFPGQSETLFKKRFRP